MAVLEKIKIWYMNLSLKYKILIFFYGVIIFVSTVLGLYSYFLTSNNIQKEIKEVSFRDIKQISNSLEFLQNDIDELSTFLVLNRDVQNAIRKDESTGYTMEQIDSLIASKKYISFIAIYGDNGFKYYSGSDGSFGINNLNIIKNSNIYKKSSELKGNPLWISLNEGNQIFILDNKFQKISMCRTILDTNTYREKGFMLICVNTSSLGNMFKESINNNGSTILLLDEQDNLITYSNKDSSFNIEEILPSIKKITTGIEGKKIDFINNKKNLINYCSVSNSGWKLVYFVPTKNILTNISSIMTVTLYVILGCLVVSFFISLYISSFLTRPIKKLLESMKKVKNGDFRRKVDFKYKDEIGMLGIEYNHMIDNISELINSVYKLQLKEKEAELKALQAQINPHFLYNTLDTIYWKAEKLKEHDLSELVYALSKLFRLTLNKGMDFNMVRDEKDFIECYLLIQKSRYKDKLSYEINIDNSILDFTMPKLILQPFVENAIIHGTERNDEKSNIKVMGYHEEDSIIFIVEDDGVGIDEDTIKTLLSEPKESEGKRKGYAIFNVYERLKLYYGEKSLLKIESSAFKGTRVTISFPKENKGLRGDKND